MEPAKESTAPVNFAAESLNDALWRGKSRHAWLTDRERYDARRACSTISLRFTATNWAATTISRSA